jgi:hypothetical protein
MKPKPLTMADSDIEGEAFMIEDVLSAVEGLKETLSKSADLGGDIQLYDVLNIIDEWFPVAKEKGGRT